jgi:hypothetical protein
LEGTKKKRCQSDRGPEPGHSASTELCNDIRVIPKSGLFYPPEWVPAVGEKYHREPIHLLFRCKARLGMHTRADNGKRLRGQINHNTTKARGEKS